MDPSPPPHRRPFPPTSGSPGPHRRTRRGQCAECGGFHGLPAMHLDFVGHAAVTARLLEVDPGWSLRPMALHPVRRSPHRPGRQPVDQAHRGGVTRVGVGDGANAKERISDAIRNAAMRFGVALDLWSKEDLTTRWWSRTRSGSTRPCSSSTARRRREELDAVGHRIAGAVNIDAQ